MAVPTSGNFEMFGTGSNTTIAGAMHNTGDNVTGIENFNDLKAAANSGKFNFTYAGEIQFPDLDISASLQFRGYPVDPGNCRAIWVDDTVNQSRYGARFRLPSGQEKNTLYGSLFGSPYTYGGNSGTVYNVCSTLVPSTWDSVTQTIVDLGNLVVDFVDGGSCYVNGECEWIEPTPTPTPTSTPTPTPVTYYYQLAHCNNGPSNSIYVFSVGTQITNGEAFSYFGNCYEYYDVDLGQTGTINLAGLSTCACPTPTPTPTSTPVPAPTSTPIPTPVTYYYQLSHCTDGPSNSIYVYSVGTQITNGDSFSYFSNCYEYYDVDLGQTGTINLAGLSTCVCATPTPTPTPTSTPVPAPTSTPTPTPTPTPVTYYYQLAHCTDGPSNSIYVYSVGNQITNGDSFSYFSSCYEYYDVDLGQTGTINLAGLSTCVCATPTSTPVPAPTSTPTPTPIPGCFTYSIQNNDLSQNLTFQYKTCEGTWVYDNVVLADSGTPDFCAEEGSVSRQSGTFSWVLTTEATTCTVTTPTPTPTSTPVPAPTSTPTPTSACPTETLGDGPTSNDACSDFTAGTGTVRYLDGPFPFASVIYRNPDCTGNAAAGYYSDGNAWRYWNGSIFTGLNGLCPTY